MGGGSGARALARYAAEESGQTVVLIALLFTVLLGFSALAIDVGRYYAERRFVQDAVDASALACVRAYSEAGGTTASAYAAGAEILGTYGLSHSPAGFTYAVPDSGDETYYDNVLDPSYLENGILPTTAPYLGCRVAVRIDLPTTLLKIANPGLSTLSLSARAYAIATGGMLPVVVPKYSNGPGPGDGDPDHFIDHTMQEGFDYQCTTTSDTNCASASTTNPGREFVLFGASQKATNDNSFRGYIALDVRDFTTTDPGTGELTHDYYNNVTASDTVNTLKDKEADWITDGYPGPPICDLSATTFNRCAQVAAINGSSSGIFIDDIDQRFDSGDYLLAQVYDGTVKTIPSFTISFPSLLVSHSTEALADQNVSFTYSSGFASTRSVVTTSFVSDDGTVTGGSGDALNPWNTGKGTSGSFVSNPTLDDGSGSYTQSWQGITTDNAPQGIYAVFLKGISSGYYADLEQVNAVTVNIADQKRQFYISTSDTYVNAASVGTNATYSIKVTDGNGQSSWDGGSGSITLAIDSCPKNGSTTLTCSFGTSPPGSQTLTTSVDNDSTLTVETSGATTNTTYSGWIRAYGTDSAGHKVTRLLKITTAVNVSSSGINCNNNNPCYVDIIGYAVFRVTQISSNDVYGKAVTGFVTDLGSAALAIGETYRLVHWETP